MKKALRSYFNSLDWVTVDENGIPTRSILGYVLGIIFLPAALPVYLFFYWLYYEKED